MAVPVLAAVMPSKESTGFLLPMLALADVMAIIYWRKHVEWRQLARLLPAALVGIVVGWRILRVATDDKLMPTIGVLVLLLLAVRVWQNARSDQVRKVPTHWWFAAVMGVLAGGTSMLANAAGPIMTIYLLTMRLEKKQFVGTGAWFFWVINLVKMPFSYESGLITKASLLTDLSVLPCILVGGVLGIVLVHRIPQRAFNVTVEVLAGATAVYLCVKGFLA